MALLSPSKSVSKKAYEFDDDMAIIKGVGADPSVSAKNIGVGISRSEHSIRYRTRQLRKIQADFEKENDREMTEKDLKAYHKAREAKAAGKETK